MSAEHWRTPADTDLLPVELRRAYVRSVTDTTLSAEPPAGRIDRARVQLAVRHIRTVANGTAVDRDGAYDILNAWNDGDDLTAREITAVLRRFDL